MPTDVVLYATFDKVTTPDGGDRLVACDTNGHLLVTAVFPPMSDEIQGEVADGAASGALLPVQVSGKDGAGINRALSTDAAGNLNVNATIAPVAPLADADPNPTTARLGADLQIFNGATWDRARGDIANGLDVDVTREPATAAEAAAAPAVVKVVAGLDGAAVRTVQLRTVAPAAADEGVVVRNIPSGTQTVDVAELPAAAALADADPNPVTTRIGANALVFNGATWDRARGDIANGLDVDVTREPATAAEAAAAPSVVKVVAGLDGAAVRTVQLRTVAPAAADEGVVVRNIPSGTQTVSPAGAATSATANVAQNAAASVVLIAANATRRTAWIYNDPSNAGILFVKWGVAASSTSFTQALLRGESMFWDGEEYSGVVEGRWSLAGAGAARVTETTP